MIYKKENRQSENNQEKNNLQPPTPTTNIKSPSIRLEETKFSQHFKPKTINPFS